jgi:hypothetical protein
MPKAPRIGQITAESTQAVKDKLAQLEQELAADKARNYEIVGVLIKQATASRITTKALHAYRNELAAERDYFRALEAVGSFIVGATKAPKG